MNNGLADGRWLFKNLKVVNWFEAFTFKNFRLNMSIIKI